MEASHIGIRVAALDDAALLAEMGARMFRDTFAADNRDADMADYLASSFAVDIQAREIAESASAFLVAECGNRPVGYTRVRRGPAPACVRGTRPVEIVRFYSDREWIGKGVGAALMNACLDFAAVGGGDVLWLAVWQDNARAIAFYRKWGFSAVGEQDFTLGSDVQHDLVMARHVGQPRRPADGAG